MTAPIVVVREDILTSSKKLVQNTLNFPTRGGARAGAGRKPSGPRARVTHAPRPPIAHRHPGLVTLRVHAGLESLRRRRNFHLVRDAIVAAYERFGTRLVHFSVMSNHIHLVCETEDEQSLARAMQGLCVRVARGLNRLWDRVGAVFEDRYHARAPSTPREVKNALNYVLLNAHHHGSALRGPDPCSSGVWFEGWERILHDDPSRGPSPLARACTWLLSVGWKRHGLLRFAPARESSSLPARRTSTAPASGPRRAPTP